MSTRKNTIISRAKFNFLLDNNIPYEGYVDGLGYVLPEVTVIAHVKNRHHITFSMHQGLSYTVQPMTTANDAIRNNPAQQQVIKQNMDYDRAKTASKLALLQSIRKQIEDLKAVNLNPRAILTGVKPTPLVSKLEWLEQKVNSQATTTLYAEDIPRELRHQHATQEYLKYHNTPYADATQATLSQHPDQGVPQITLDHRQRQQNYQKAVQNWRSVDPIATQISEGMAYGMMAAPLAVLSVEAGGVPALLAASRQGLKTAFATSTEMAVLKGGMSIAAQTGVNSRQKGVNGQRRGWENGFREVNWVAVGGDAFFAVPMTASLVSSIIDLKPLSQDKILQITGYNKNLKTTAIDASSAFIFGKMGSQTWNALNPVLRNSSERYIMYFSTQTWNYIGAYGAASRFNEKASTNYE